MGQPVPSSIRNASASTTAMPARSAPNNGSKDRSSLCAHAASCSTVSPPAARAGDGSSASTALPASPERL
eukprot:23692-Chlamydomonas_euryale.AAC.1